MNFMETASFIKAANIKKATLLLCLPLLFVPVLSSAQSSGDQHPLLSSRFQVSAGAIFFNSDYKLSANGNKPGTEIDFDQALGVDDSDASALGAILWRFGEKWSLRMQGFRLNVDGKGVLDEDIQFGDYTFGQGSNIKAGLKTSVVRAFIGRTFSTGQNYEFGAGVGLHWMQLDAFISGEAFINDQSPSFRRESVRADLPLPNIGAWYAYAPTNRWLLTSRVDWFDASVGDYSGGLLDMAVGAQFQISDHFGISAQYGYFELDGKIKKSSWNGKAEISATGPQLFLTANW